MILGFDISTSIIGYCILENNGQLVDIGYLDLKKEKNLYKKLDMFRDFLDDLQKQYGNCFEIYVEAPLQRSNNQNVVNLLQRWNGKCCVELYRMFQKEPVLIVASTARKLLGIKIPRGSDTKNLILTHVKSLNIVSEDKWIFKKTGRPKDFCYDMADAFVVAITGCRSAYQK